MLDSAAARAPLCAAALNSASHVAPSPVIVVLAPTITHSTPIESAFTGLIEVALGAVTGLMFH